MANKKGGGSGWQGKTKKTAKKRRALYRTLRKGKYYRNDLPF